MQDHAVAVSSTRGRLFDDLAAIVGGAPDGLLLPKCDGGNEVTRLDHYLTALECCEGVTAESIRIMVVATETPAAMFELGSYRNASRRLHGLTWGAEDLATAVGAASNRDDDGAHGADLSARPQPLPARGQGGRCPGLRHHDPELPRRRHAGDAGAAGPVGWLLGQVHPPSRPGGSRIQRRFRPDDPGLLMRAQSWPRSGPPTERAPCR